MRVPLPLHSYRRNVPANAARIVNMQAEQMPPEGKTPVSLFGCPGVRAFAAPPVGRGRGLSVRGSTLYALAGSDYFKISAGGVATSLGSIPGTTRGYFASNTTQTVIVSDGVGYVETGGVITPITDPDFLIRHVGPCGFVDNYILFIDIGSQEFIGSALGDATAYDALDFASAEGAPDNLVGFIVDHRQPILFGSTSTELWYDSGAQGFPFERSSGGFLEMGCLAPRSIAKADNSVYWLASDLTVRRLSGDSGVRVSHHGLEEALKGYANPADAEALSFTHEGHLQYALNFITDNATWVLDVTTAEWHERDSFPAQVWRAVDAVSLNGVTYVQDRETGAVGLLDSTCSTEWGDPIRREWTYGSVYKDNNRLFHGELNTVMQVGLGNSAGSDPQILLQASDDGGVTFQTISSESLGKWGHHRTRVATNRLGSARDRIYRRIITDPVLVRVYDTQLDVIVGTG